MGVAVAPERVAVLTVQPLEPSDDGERRYEVTGGREPHTVLWADSGPICDCQAFRHGRRPCKHVAAIERTQRQAADLQGPLLDAMSEDDLLDVLGPSDADDRRRHPAPGAPAPTADQRPEPLVRSLAELLADPAALQPPEAVIPRLAYRGRVTLLAAREKAGKSTLLTAGAAAVSQGGDFLGEPCPAGPVLWVTSDQEHPGELAQRAVRFGADPAAFHVLWPRNPFADLAAAVERVAPGVLIVDSLAPFARVKDPFSSAEWPGVLLPLVRLARERDAAVVLAHHTTKAENGGYRDSTAIGAAVDLILELQRDGDGPRRKVSALGRWTVAGFTLELVGDGYRLVAVGELSLDARLLAFVQQHPACSKLDVRSSVGGRAEDVDRALAQLIGRGAVRDTGTDRRHAYEAVTTATAEDPDAPPF